jgi:hypothetical protein
LRVPDVAGVHHHKPIDELLLARPLVVARPWKHCLRVDLVRNHSNPIVSCTLLDEALAHTFADGHDVITPTEVIAHESSQELNDGPGSSACPARARFREDVLGDREERHPKTARDRGSKIPDDRRVVR